MGLFDLFPGRSTPNLFDVVKFVDAVTSDPVTEGKKDGYERAANEYEPIYQELKKEYEQAIAEIQRQRNAYDRQSDESISYLAQLEKERDRMQASVNDKARQVASNYGISVSSLMGSFSSTNVVRDTRWDMMNFITDSRMQKRKVAEKAGYSEAKQLYERKLNSLHDKLNIEKENGSKQLKEYADLIANILKEIENEKIKIADLKIALQEG